MKRALRPTKNGTPAEPLPPCSLNAERSVLGSMLRNNATIPEVRRLLTVGDFYTDAGQKVMSSILALADAGKPADVITVSDELKRRGHIEDLGGYAYLGELLADEPTGANVAHHAAIVKECATHRAVVHLCRMYAGLALSPAGPAVELVGRLGREIAALSAGPAAAPNEVDADDLLAEPEGEPLEYLPLLGKDGYFVRGWSNLLAGYPKAGKTELLVACIPEWLRLGLTVLYITEEPRKLWRRRLAGRPGPWRGLKLVPGLGIPAAELLARACAGDEDVVVVDTIRNLGLLTDENDNAAIARDLAPWVAGTRAKAKTFLPVHHMRKGAGEHGEGISGGHALFGAVDMALELRRDNQQTRRTVRGYGRLIQPDDLLYGQEDGGAMTVLGDPSGVTLEEVRRRLRLVLTADWTKTDDLHQELTDPRPGKEIFRQALLAEAKAGTVERDPPISARAQGKTIRWRLKGG